MRRFGGSGSLAQTRLGGSAAERHSRQRKGREDVARTYHILLNL